MRCPVYQTHEVTPDRRHNLSRSSERKSSSAAKLPNTFQKNILYSNPTSNYDHASSTQPNNLSNITSKTQKELYKAELAKVWDIVYKERQKVIAAEKKARSLQKELDKMKSYIASQEAWYREREAEIVSKYKAKKESLRAQLRSKQTDQINQLAAVIGLDSY